MREPLPLPDGLSRQAAAIWKAETAGRTRSPGRALLLEQALRAFDRAESYRAQVEKDGATFKTETTGAVHAHPLVALAADEIAAFTRLAKMLDLQWTMGTDGGA